MGKVRSFQTLALNPRSRSNHDCRRGLELGMNACDRLHNENLCLPTTGLRGRPYDGTGSRPPGGPHIYWDRGRMLPYCWERQTTVEYTHCKVYVYLAIELIHTIVTYQKANDWRLFRSPVSTLRRKMKTLCNELDWKVLEAQIDQFHAALSALRRRCSC